MKLSSRSVRWVRKFDSGRVRLIDWFPPLVLVVLAVPGLIHAGDPLTLSALLTLALTAVLGFRRRSPVTVFTAVCAIALAQRSTGEHLVGDVAFLVAFYTLTSLSSARAAAIAAIALEFGIGLSLAWWPTGEQWWTSFLLLSGTVTTAGVLGAYARTRAALLTQLRERADRLERERDQQFALAAADERAHIARELHDIIAHHLTVMIALADGAAASVSSQPTRAGAVMTTVSATGRKALADTRRLLGVLRAEPTDTDLRPQPDINRVNSLLEGVRAAGLPVTLTVTGDPQELSAGLQLTTYRIIQEALTNVLKHAGPGTRACLRLTYGEDGVVSIDVRDDGLGPRPLAAGASESSKHGLDGMRERVAAWDGDLHAGPASPRGWLVSAQLRTHRVDTGASAR